MLLAAPGRAQTPAAPAPPNRMEAPDSTAAPSQAPPNPAAQNPAVQNPAAQLPAPVSESPSRATQPEAPVAALPPQIAFADVFSQLAARVSGVVVNISTQAGPSPPAPGQEQAQNSPGKTLDEVFRDFFGDKSAPTSPGPRAASLGSGFIIDPSGLIVTNHHVIANSQQITVTLSDNTALQAQVIGRDSVTDLALLKVEPKNPLPAASWGDSSKIRVGDWVLAIGNPFGLGGSVTAGIISAVARDIHSSPYDDYLQTDASINRGNSGGPMFNLAGEVVGINTVIYSPSGGSIGLGFALPSGFAKPIVEQLRTNGKVERGWMRAPIQPRSTLPLVLSCSTIGLANAEGSAKPMPIEPPDGE